MIENGEMIVIKYLKQNLKGNISHYGVDNNIPGRRKIFSRKSTMHSNLFLIKLEELPQTGFIIHSHLLAPILSLGETL